MVRFDFALGSFVIGKQDKVPALLLRSIFSDSSFNTTYYRSLKYLM